MAETYKVLGQAKPAAATLTDLYTVPAATQAIVAAIVVCNQSSSADTFRISVAPGGAADAVSQYIAWDTTVNGNDSLPLTLGIGLSATDKIRCRSTNGNVSFTASGVEIT
jgi:hypothetical protein